MMLQLKDKRKKLFFYLILFFFLSTQINKHQTVEGSFNTKIKEIEVFGLSKNKNLQVVNSLNSLFLQNILFIKKKSFLEILNKNNLIESFKIKKIYPSKIRVEIKKTSFLAITNKNNNKYYIGSNGKLISFEDSEKINKNLPFVFSKSNYEDFVKLKKNIDKSDFKFSDINSFYYFPSNRWDFKTKNGLLIKLPEKNVLESLQIAYKIKSNEQFKNKKVIDLRINNQIITYND
tara:strand:+ start:578 stop:1276 length:699 start_codon:yes stop_codon:yes gene_type:complete